MFPLSTTTDQPEQWPADDFVSTDDLVRRLGVEPIISVDQFAQPDPFESDAEYEAFLADLYASRRASVS